MSFDFTSDATVYIVDDDPLIRESSARMFSSLGIQVRTFASGSEFLEHRRQAEFGCIILDYQMPGTDGLELQEELAAREDDLPIIFLTAHGDIPTSVKAMKSGAIDFLTKPVDRRTLLNCVEQAIAWHKKHRAEHADRQNALRQIAKLTPREFQVMRLAIEGLLNKQIAKRLGIAERTVKLHRQNMMRKMNSDSLISIARLWDRVKEDFRDETDS